ncbi:MMPL family transporter [Lactobacillus sp. S2-2]|uniref:MMPL family transporter n=1 Tax=Lactobacillus sp. S2-2 TaxID=2692917 RepID=UPI001F3317E6|nr:MMPL family transporter [Lactobacillus sp. S2-2]MCF6515610.1 MMPL family transporter [Lactobacillus sp. S2-2]
MKKMLNKQGQWIFKNKWKTIIAWLVVLAAFLGFMGHYGSNFDQNLKMSGIPSTDVQKTIKKEFHKNLDAGTMNVVIQGKKGQITKSDVKKQINNKIGDIKGKYGIKSIDNPYENQLVSDDKSTVYVSITFNKDAQLVSKHAIKSIENKFNSLKDQNKVKVAYNGTANISPLTFGVTAEIIGIIIAFILLLILFRSFVTAGLPIITALVGLASGVLLVTIGTSFFTIVDLSKTLATMLSLAVGIDYALFIIHRYRTDLNEQKDKQKAMGEALANAGASVLFAGVTVIIAVAGLSIVGIDFLTQMGISTAVSIAFAILSALTLLPALISVLHKFIKPDETSVDAKIKQSGWFSNSIIKHPIVSALISIVVIALFAIPSSHMRLGMPYDGALPKDNTTRQAYDMMSDKFGEGSNSQLVGVIKFDKDASQSDKDKAINKVTNKMKKLDDVDMVMPMKNEKALKQMKSPQYQAKVKEQGEAYVKQYVMTAMQKNPALAQSPQAQQQLTQKATQEYKKKVEAKAKKAVLTSVQVSDNKKYGMFVVIPKTGPASAKTETLAKNINSFSDNNLKKNNKANIVLTGSNAVNIDITEKLNNAIPVFAGLVIVLAFVLLMIVFKSFVIPFFAMVGFGLSLFASFGLVTLVVQDGFLKQLFGISVGSPILAFLPIITIGVLFGLAMDYEVFMVSRIREEYLKTKDNERSVLVGLKMSGPVIITAALIMVAVFGSFALSPDPTIKSLGLVLAFGVFIDAFLIRLIFVPSMIKLCGKWNWVFPGQKNK